MLRQAAQPQQSRHQDHKQDKVFHWYDPPYRSKIQQMWDLREDADLTQDQLVKNTGDATTYTNCEQGKREPPFELIIRLAKLYRVSIDYIAGLTPYPAPLRSRK